jgi:L-threonylcarbamoyladenylate synthase
VKTLVTTSVTEAAGFVRGGGVCAFATETVYGLGADIYNEKAIARIFEAKGRPADNPLIAHVSAKGQIAELAAAITDDAVSLIDAFFPGPLTVVLKKKERIPSIATAGLDTIGIRMPRFDLARRFIEACGVPLAAPSANLSGRPSPTTWQAVLEDLDGRIDCILQGEPAEIGLESTVVDCTGDVPLVLRTGAVSLEELQGLVPGTILYEPPADEPARSPGVRHRHYSPQARVEIINAGTAPSGRRAFIGMSPPDGGFEITRICGSIDEYARELYEFFRECDRQGIELIVCEPVPETGLGAALMDRIRRAVAR